MDTAWCKGPQYQTESRIERFEELKEIKAPTEQGSVEMSSLSSYMGKKTIEIHNVSKSYGDRQLIKDFTYTFLKNDRIGFIGGNGCGKSTLMKIIAGLVEPDEGYIEIGQTIKIGYFMQENEELDANSRVIDYIKETAEFIRTKDGLISASKMLERFLFDSSMQYAKIEKLSGGEKRRLYLLKILMEAPNVLILDEPTNDLDIQTLAVLEEYLNQFDGIVITVSHDRYFLDKIVRRIFAYEENGQLVQYEGGFSDYYEKITAGQTAAEETKAGNSEKKENVKYKKEHSAKLKFSYKEQREYETIEQDIENLEEKLAQTEADIIKFATDFVKLRELTELKENLEIQLEEKMERYVYLEELAEQIEAQKSNK